MKKLTLLFLGVTGFIGSYAQDLMKPSKRIGTAQVKTVADKTYIGSSTLDPKVRKTRGGFPSSVGAKEAVGTSTYDLQTNGSMQRRIITNGNNVSVAWTMSKETNVTATSAFTDRGTGYAHYDGSAWSAAPTARLEGTTRTGFGSLAVDGAGNEVYIVHDGSTNTLFMNKKTGSTWAFSTLTTNVASQAIWPHIATSGNWMYVIASPADSNIHTNGIRNGYYFSRSSDNGATWVDNMIPMPLIDSVGHYRGGGNSYAISARGSNVAILFGDMGTDLTLLKSTDYGATWTKKVIFDWPLNHFDFASANMTDVNGDLIPDTLETNDGSHSMVIDANNTVHVAFPVVRVYKDGTSTGYNFFYSTSIVYYNSVADSLVAIDNIFNIHHDCDGDSILGLGDNYTGATGEPDAIYNSIGLLTQPSISIVSGSPQKVLIAYTSIMDSDTTIDDSQYPYWGGASTPPYTGQNYRDIMVAVSPDNGATWKPHPVNVTRTGHFEEAFVTTPEIISGADFHLFYQADIEPGTILQNDDAYNAEFQNIMIEQKVPVSLLLLMADSVSAPCGQQQLPLGVKSVVNGSAGLVSIFPNPASDIANVAMKFFNVAKSVTIEMNDISGNVVYSSKLENILESTHKIPVSGLSNGMYVIRVITEQGTITRKFVKD